MSINHFVKIRCGILSDSFFDFLDLDSQRALTEFDRDKIADLNVIGSLGGLTVYGNECAVAGIVSNRPALYYSCNL